MPEQSPTARLTALPVAELEEELGESFEEWDEESDGEEEIENILRAIYGAVDQEGDRMLAEEAPHARGRLSLHAEASQEMAREVGAETFEADEETVQRHVEVSPPPQGMIRRDDMESCIGVWLPVVINANFFRRKTPWIHTNNFRKFEYIHVVVAVSAFETFSMISDVSLSCHVLLVKRAKQLTR